MDRASGGQGGGGRHAPRQMVLHDVSPAATAQEATREVKRILGASTKNFPFPKPTALIKRIIQITVGAEEFVLDSTAGSGTTAHAVLALNKEDASTRKFILV